MPLQEIKEPSEQDRLAGWSGPGWYFWDAATRLHGPHSSKEFCQEQETTYARALLSLANLSSRPNLNDMTRGQVIAEAADHRKVIRILKEMLEYEYRRGYQNGFEAMREVKIIQNSGGTIRTPIKENIRP